MQQISIRKEDPRAPQARALVEASHAFLRSLYSRDECHYLDLDALAGADMTFLVAVDDSGHLGCGALKNLGSYGEIKSMFVDPAARGKGVGSAILEALEGYARKAKLPLLCLETGHVLFAAHRIYEAAGYTRTGAFGDYVAVEASVFMEKRLT